jgi:hypothetical protein
MDKGLLLGLWRFILRIPRPIWQKEVSRSAQRAKASLDFMTDDHHRVRDFVVREMPRMSEPITPQVISQSLNLEVSGVNSILDEFEKNMTFLFRDADGCVTWAYPVTVEPTPHRLSFSSGESVFAA